MAHARPLVLSDIPENREVGGDAARYFTCGRVDELETRLRELLDDADARAALSAQARARAEETYNWDFVADQVESFYYRVLGR